MKLNHIGAYPSVEAFVADKVAALEKSDMTFSSLYALTFRERENVFSEKSDGYRIRYTTYGECADRTEFFARKLLTLPGLSRDSVVGLYMQNCEEYVELLFAILMVGARPLLLNTRMDDRLLSEVISSADCALVLSDGKDFSSAPFSLPTYTLEALEALSPVENFTPAFADEILLSTSGTSSHVKLCAYSGRAICHQVLDSSEIIRTCPAMRTGCEGEIKLLTFLPFYHVFGLTAVLFWFSFFSRTFVFLKDFSPATILGTVRRHKVTHIFAVPMLWNRIYEEALRKISERGEKTEKKFLRGLALSEKLSGVPLLGKFFVRRAFREVRDGIFGESIRFLIVGGSAISRDVLRFFNGIGYRLANGYGMTEIGITSVELSSDFRHLTSGSCGKPFASVEYKISDAGELLVRGGTLATRVTENGTPVGRDADGWFNSHDLGRLEDGRLFLFGRRDDLLIGQNGENLNPDLLEPGLRIEGAKALALVADKSGDPVRPTLVVGIHAHATDEEIRAVTESAEAALTKAGLASAVPAIFLTTDPLIGENDFKVNRSRISASLSAKSLTAAVAEAEDAEDSSELSLRVRAIVASALSKSPEEVSPSANFFFDLGGTSLDYLTAVAALRSEFGIDFPAEGGQTLATVRALCDFIRKNG